MTGEKADDIKPTVARHWSWMRWIGDVQEAPWTGGCVEVIYGSRNLITAGANTVGALTSGGRP